MYIRIKEKCERVSAPILNGEAVIVEVLKPELVITQKEILNFEPSTFDEDGLEIKGLQLPSTFEDIKTLTVSTTVFAESDTELKIPMALYDINRTYSFIISGDCNSLIAAKGIVNKIKEVYNLVDTDFEILAEKTWRIPERTIRVYIPFTSVVENPNYNGLVNGLMSAGVPFFKLEDGYGIYLQEIYPEHKALLSIDPNVLIEE